MSNKGKFSLYWVLGWLRRKRLWENLLTLNLFYAIMLVFKRMLLANLQRTQFSSYYKSKHLSSIIKWKYANVWINQVELSSNKYKKRMRRDWSRDVQAPDDGLIADSVFINQGMTEDCGSVCTVKNVPFTKYLNNFLNLTKKKETSSR